MPSARVLFLSSLLACVCLVAQQPVLSSQAPPAQNASDLDWAPMQGIFVSPVKDIPFSATVSIESRHTRNDGKVTTLTSQAMIARDSLGRIRSERHAFVPETFQGASPLLNVLLFDPATHLSTALDPDSHSARRKMIATPKWADAQPNESVEDLGVTMLSGIQAKGTRLKRAVQHIQKPGSREPSAVVREFWYSDELKMNILEKFDNGLGDGRSLAVLAIQRQKPENSLFEVPSGYAVVDVTSPTSKIPGSTPSH